MKMKYIIVVDSEGRELPVIFAEGLSHKAVLKGIQEGVRREARDNGKSSWESPELVSAGFVYGLHVDSANGASESLRYGPGYVPEDMRHTTEARDVDVNIINEGYKRLPTKIENFAMTPPPETEARAIAPSVAKCLDEVNRSMIKGVLNKSDPAALHLSFNKRKVLAFNQVKSKVMIDADDATINAYIDDIVREINADG